MKLAHWLLMAGLLHLKQWGLRRGLGRATTHPSSCSLYQM